MYSYRNQVVNYVPNRDDESNGSWKYDDSNHGEEDEEHMNESISSDVSYDEGMILEGVRCSENDDDLMQFIEVDECSKSSIINPDFEKLYLLLKKKTLLLMRIATKYLRLVDTSAENEKDLLKTNQRLVDSLSK